MVLQPAAANDASTACADARADSQVAIGDPRRGGRGGFLELPDLHTVPAGMDVHVAGFERGDLGPAGGEEKIARLGLAQAGHRRSALVIGDRGEEVLHDRLGDVDVGDALQPAPGGVAVDLEHHEPAVGRAR